MTTMIRKQIYIEPEQEAQLKQVARQLGLSEAEVIRRAIDLHLLELRNPQQASKLWEEEVAFMRSRIGLAPAGGKRTWQREDAYDEDNG